MPASTVHAIIRRHSCSRSVPHPAREDDRPLPARAAWRAGAHLRQEAWPVHPARSSRDRRPSPPSQVKAGWQHLFVAIDDATRLAYAELYPYETNASAISFLESFSDCSTSSTISPSSASSPITAPASNAAVSTPATNAKSQPNGHYHTDRRPTARPSASSAPCWSAVPTPPPTQQSTTARKPSHRPSTPPIATDHTAPSTGETSARQRPIIISAPRSAPRVASSNLLVFRVETFSDCE